MPENRYQSRELLGKGATSEVYRGFDAHLGRAVAIKRLRPDLVTNAVFRSRFHREALAAGGLDHPAIVAVYDAGEERDATGTAVPFIVMELIEGRSLRDALHEEGKLSPGRALEVAAVVLDALACSHAAGIVHRDIKPGNVMLTSTGEVKVADFGIARAVSESSGTATMTGTVMGTAQYLSPEQGRGEAADARSDIYSVGCMLYELLVGHPPFSGESMVSIVVQHIYDSPTPPSVAAREISTGVDAIILKALAKNPAERYQTASEMKGDIERVLSGKSPEATSLLGAPLIETLGKPRRGAGQAHRQPAAGLVVIMTGLLVVAMGVGAFGIQRSTRPEAAGLRTTEVPAVLGLGKVGAASLLRNARLLPSFELVHGADDASIDTAMRQSPAAGEIAPIGSAVTVVINVGPEQAMIPQGVTLRSADQMNEADGRGAGQGSDSGNPRAGQVNDSGNPRAGQVGNAKSSSGSPGQQRPQAVDESGSDDGKYSQADKRKSGKDKSLKKDQPGEDLDHSGDDLDH
ncbi:MAG TPA: protein kinase [Propionibacteriaceae bacterium]|nr:protein kinase [Propionibacteriaceae bacterium]